MSRLKGIIKKVRLGDWISLGLIALFIVCLIIFSRIAGTLPTLDAADAFRGGSDMGFAQIGCYLTEADALEEAAIYTFRSTLNTQMTEASIVAPEDGSLYRDAYSAIGDISVSTDFGSATVKTIGVGGDFFLFHPLYLRSGSYISDDDFMQDRVVLEIQRGCIRGCRFCQAGMLYRPTREKSLEILKQHAYRMLKNTGHEEISLSSLSSSDYSELAGIVNFLIDEFQDQNINVCLPSLRIDAFSLDVMSKVQDVKKSSLTFAPEAGSQRMRNVINKGLTEEIILDGANQAFHGGWNKVKLYFMLGLPLEEEEDRKAIAHLAEKIAENYYDEIPKEQRVGKCQITVSTSFFVPKPFTPFQWARMYTPGDYLGFAKTVNHEIKDMKNQKSIRYNWHQADETLLEGIFARGDRRVAKAIRLAYENGALFDAWTEYWNYDRWVQAFADAGLDMDFYTLRERDRDEIFPWDFIRIGVTKKFLWKEWERAHAREVTPNCRQKCSGCGAAQYGGGVCTECRE